MLLYYIANFTLIESAYPERQSTEKHRTLESCAQNTNGRYTKGVMSWEDLVIWKSDRE